MTWRDVGVFRNYIGFQQFSTCKLPVCRAKRPGYDDNLPPGSLVPDIAMVNENDPYGGSDRGSTAYSDAAGRPRPKKARSALLLAIVVIFVLGAVVTLFVWPKETADSAAKGRAENPAVIGAVTVSEMHRIDISTFESIAAARLPCGIRLDFTEIGRNPRGVEKHPLREPLTAQ